MPDPSRRDGPFRAYANDPGWSEAWWWLLLPVGLALFLIAAYAAAPDWYRTHILPEGYGLLELSHFFVPFAGLVIAIRQLLCPTVRRRRLVLAFLVLAALACLYIAGEEHSWGQHFFHWETPEAWSRLNRQNETNLHNTLDVFDKTPRLLLELAVFLGGIGVPLAAVLWPRIRRNRWSLFLPAGALAPVALAALVFKLSSVTQDTLGATLVFRPSEASETFFYLFILFYLIVFARRLGELEADDAAATALLRSASALR